MTQCVELTNDCDIRFGAIPIEILSFAQTQHINPSAHDDNQSKNFGISKVILNFGGPLDAKTIDKAQKRQANSCNQSQGVIRWVTIREKGFGQVQRKSQTLDGSRARSDYKARKNISFQ